MTGTTTKPTLTNLDRCDRCGAQAYVRVVLPGGGELLFCRHHAKSHDSKLRSVAVEYHDETHKLSVSRRGLALTCEGTPRSGGVPSFIRRQPE